MRWCSHTVKLWLYPLECKMCHQRPNKTYATSTRTFALYNVTHARFSIVSWLEVLMWNEPEVGEHTANTIAQVVLLPHQHYRTEPFDGCGDGWIPGGCMIMPFVRRTMWFERDKVRSNVNVHVNGNVIHTHTQQATIPFGIIGAHHTRIEPKTKAAPFIDI